MAVAGSILLVGGIGGSVAYLGLLTFRPRLFSRSVTVFALTVMFLVAGAGLVLLTATTGGRSLHTGG